MVRIAICDDSFRDAGRVEEYMMQGPLEAECDVFSSGEELLRTIGTEKQAYDMYILDIEMTGMSGIELAGIIREQDISCLIVFLTEYPEYVHNIFHAFVFDYIIKPITKERVEELLLRAKRYLVPARKLFHYTFNKVQNSIKVNDIYFFQKERRKVVFYLRDGSSRYSYMSMEDVIKQLEESNFCRVNYSTIINLKYIVNMQRQEIVMENGTTITCSKSLLNSLKQKHLRYINRI